MGSLVFSVGFFLMLLLVPTILLRAAMHWATRQDVEFVQAYLFSFLLSLLYFIAVLAPQLLPFSFLLHAGLLAARYKLDYVKALQVAAIMIGTGLGLAVSIYGVTPYIYGAYFY